MTGWRIGYAIGDAGAIKALANYQSQALSSPSQISQRAALAALEHGWDSVADMRAAFARRLDYCVKRIQGLRLRFVMPAGAFYLFFDTETVCRARGWADGQEFCTHLLEDQGVALVPGDAFGMPGWARLSFAASDDELEKAFDRIEAFLAVGVYNARRSRGDPRHERQGWRRLCRLPPREIRTARRPCGGRRRAGRRRGPARGAVDDHAPGPALSQPLPRGERPPRRGLQQRARAGRCWWCPCRRAPSCGTSRPTPRSATSPRPGRNSSWRGGAGRGLGNVRFKKTASTRRRTVAARPAVPPRIACLSSN